MAQTMHRRLKEVEEDPELQWTLDALFEKVEQWHADQINQQRLEEQPPDCLCHQVQELRRKLLGESRGLPI
jgi:hypothetical protein